MAAASRNFGEALLSAADGVVAHKSQSGVTDHPVRSASTPPHEEGTTLAQKNLLEKTSNDTFVSPCLRVSTVDPTRKLWLDSPGFLVRGVRL